MIIKEWALEDRPREKLYQNGPKQLTNAELLAIIIGSGTKSLSAVELAKNILSHANNDLDQLSTMNISNMCKIKGIGPAKAITIKAVLELANRKGQINHVHKKKITSSHDAFRMLQPSFADLNIEEFWVLFLNRANKVIGKNKISEGGVSATVVDPKVIFHHALSHFATGIILAHNHPSGNLVPSEQDISITQKIAISAKSLEINLFDHLIIAGGSYYSFADQGMLK